MDKKEIINGIKKEGLNFIACNYYKLTKEQLKEICLAYMNATKTATEQSVINYENFIALDDLETYLD